MKKYIILILLSFVCNLSNANKWDLLKSGKRWNTLQVTYNPDMTNHDSTTYFVKFAGDTTIHAQTYRRVWQTTRGELDNWATTGFVREDSLVGLYFRNMQGKEGLLYKYNLNLGDSVVIQNKSIARLDSIKYLVTGIDSILIDGMYRKRYTMSEKDVEHMPEVWIEGIDSSLGILGCGNIASGGASRLLCCYDNNVLTYKNPDCQNCYYSTDTALSAQEFSTKFLLMDKHGSKDSIELGYSATATFGIDAEFEEISYGSPVNTSNFNASIISNGGNKSLIELINNNEVATYSKKQIVPIIQGTYIEQNAIGIMVPVASLPVTISWDKSEFSNSQRNYSIITDWTIGGWFDAGQVSFRENLKDTSSIQIKNVSSNYTITEGSIQYPMYIFYVAFADFGNISVGVKDIIDDNRITVYPLITKDIIHIKNDSFEKVIKYYTVTSVNGKLIDKVRYTSSDIDFSSYLNGIYILSINTTEDIIHFKIIKN